MKEAGDVIAQALVFAAPEGRGGFFAEVFDPGVQSSAALPVGCKK
jgi:hypothetical protein